MLYRHHGDPVMTGILRSAKGAKDKLANLVAGRTSTPETKPTPKSNVQLHLDSLDPNQRQEELRTVRNTRNTSLTFDRRSRIPRNESKSRLDTLKYILEISNKRSDTKKTKGNLDNASTKKSNRISNASSY